MRTPPSLMSFNAPKYQSTSFVRRQVPISFNLGCSLGVGLTEIFSWRSAIHSWEESWADSDPSYLILRHEESSWPDTRVLPHKVSRAAWILQGSEWQSRVVGALRRIWSGEKGKAIIRALTRQRLGYPVNVRVTFNEILGYKEAILTCVLIDLDTFRYH